MSNDTELLEEYRQEAEGRALLVEFDELGRVQNRDTSKFAGLQGLVKQTPTLQQQRVLKQLCESIKKQVPKENMVAWAGTDNDSTRLRAMAFPSQRALNQLHNSGVRLCNPHKTGRDAEKDEIANRNACTVLNDTVWNEETKEAVVGLVQSLKEALPNEDSLDIHKLIAVQPNLHNGAPFLKAHMDYPLHDGFGKAIVTFAIHGNATILLYGPYNDEIQDHEGVWRFPLKEGECYCLTGLARTNCLHAVYAKDEEERESLNLRFGLYSVDDLNKEVWIANPLANYND